MVRRRARGFTYLAVLFAVAVLMTGLALVGEMWETAAKRERETELLFVGNQYRKAIERYVISGKAQYPRTLDDLLQDSRQPSVQRYLRKLYPDPVTGKNEWGLIKGPDGGIGGVYSLSDATPLKSAGFRARDAALAGAQKYSDWKFVYTPSVLPAAPKPAELPAAGLPSAELPAAGVSR